MENIFPETIQQAILNFLTPQIVWWFFLAMMGLIVLISIVILWHWTKYGVGLLSKAGIQIIYLAITGALVGVFFIMTTRLISTLA